MKLSVLIPSIPSRTEQLKTLLDELHHQVHGGGYTGEVEVMALVDNKVISIGEKHNRLLAMAQGEYVSFVHDDDDIAPTYIEDIVKATATGNDVITFIQRAVIDGVPVPVTFHLMNENDPLQWANEDETEYKPLNRAPFPCCAWKREKVQDIKFPDVGYGEDAAWCEQAKECCETERHIPHVLHFYKFDSEKSEAPTESNEVWKNPNE